MLSSANTHTLLPSLLCSISRTYSHTHRNSREDAKQGDTFSSHSGRYIHISAFLCSHFHLFHCQMKIWAVDLVRGVPRVCVETGQVTVNETGTVAFVMMSH